MAKRIVRVKPHKRSTASSVSGEQQKKIVHSRAVGSRLVYRKSVHTEMRLIERPNNRFAKGILRKAQPPATTKAIGTHRAEVFG